MNCKILHRLINNFLDEYRGNGVKQRGPYVPKNERERGRKKTNKKEHKGKRITNEESYKIVFPYSCIARIEGWEGTHKLPGTSLCPNVKLQYLLEPPNLEHLWSFMDAFLSVFIKK